MSRWFRFYDDAINDPKILKLSDKLHRVWIGILCAASKNDGELPPLEDLALVVRMKPEKLQAALESLKKSGLIDEVEAVLKPHNWDKRQFKSDVSTERVKRFRNVSKTVSETPPETEQIQNTETEEDSGGADAPPDKVISFRRYAFEGRLVRLDQAGFDRWKQTYHAIPDITAALQSADDYYSENPPKDGKWFFPVSRWLEKEHTKLVTEAEKQRREARSF